MKIKTGLLMLAVCLGFGVLVFGADDNTLPARQKVDIVISTLSNPESTVEEKIEALRSLDGSTAPDVLRAVEESRRYGHRIRFEGAKLLSSFELKQERASNPNAGEIYRLYRLFCVEDSNVKIRIYSIRNLTGDRKKMAQIIEAALEDEDQRVRRAALRKLETL